VFSLMFHKIFGDRNTMSMFDHLTSMEWPALTSKLASKFCSKEK